jgi:hypothetical protein
MTQNDQAWQQLKREMIEKQKFWESKSVEELIEEIEEIYDFETLGDALIALEKKAPRKAIELGTDIIKNDKGDQFLQADIVTILFDNYAEEIIHAIENRQKPIEWCLLEEIVSQIEHFHRQNKQVDVPKSVLEKIFYSYEIFDRKEKIDHAECPYRI